MGNRAVIATAKSPSLPNEYYNSGIGIYLHWNGGRDSVEAFLRYCELKGYTSPEKSNYGWCNLIKVIGNFFGDGMSLDIDKVGNLDCDNGDNGVYIISDWKIIGRKYNYGFEQRSYKLEDMLRAIDEAQPEKQRLGEDFFNSEQVSPAELKIGDEVLIQDFDGTFGKFEVVGFGEEGMIRNGSNVEGVPYVNRFKREEGYSWNINNFLTSSLVRKLKE